MTNEEREQVNKAINKLWEMYDAAEISGQQDLANEFKARAFQLVERLPENRVYLQLPH